MLKDDLINITKEIKKNEESFRLLKQSINFYIIEIMKLTSSLTDINLKLFSCIIPELKIILIENYYWLFINNEKIGHLVIDKSKTIKVVLIYDNNKKVLFSDVIISHIEYSLLTLLNINKFYTNVLDRNNIKYDNNELINYNNFIQGQ